MFNYGRILKIKLSSFTEVQDC